MYYETSCPKTYVPISQFKSVRAKYIKGFFFTAFVKFLTSENVCFSEICDLKSLVHCKTSTNVPPLQSFISIFESYQIKSFSWKNCENPEKTVKTSTKDTKYKHIINLHVY